MSSKEKFTQSISMFYSYLFIGKLLTTYYSEQIDEIKNNDHLFYNEFEIISELSNVNGFKYNKDGIIINHSDSDSINIVNFNTYGDIDRNSFFVYKLSILDIYKCIRKLKKNYPKIFEKTWNNEIKKEYSWIDDEFLLNFEIEASKKSSDFYLDICDEVIVMLSFIYEAPFHCFSQTLIHDDTTEFKSYFHESCYIIPNEIKFFKTKSYYSPPKKIEFFRDILINKNNDDEYPWTLIYPIIDLSPYKEKLEINQKSCQFLTSCRHFSEALKYMNNNDHFVAILHFVISIESLFSHRTENKSKNFKDALKNYSDINSILPYETFKKFIHVDSQVALPKNLAKIRNKFLDKFIADIYQMRSNYVHGHGFFQNELFRDYEINSIEFNNLFDIKTKSTTLKLLMEMIKKSIIKCSFKKN